MMIEPSAATSAWCRIPRLLYGLALGAMCGCGSGAEPLQAEDTDSARYAVTAVYSDLWGQSGERWTPQSRLPYFAFAGYRTGTQAIPTPAAVVNVKSFGAVGDGVADDTQAFLDAIASAANGAISVPAGRYKITQILKLNRSNLVLRGAGSGSTTLYFPNSLTDLLGYAPAWAGNSGAWSWAGGFLWSEGRDNGAKLANVTGSALRGSKSISVDSTANISLGSTVRLVEFNTDGTLGLHVHAEQSYAGSATPQRLIDFATKVVGISGTTLTLERPLPADVRAVWTPQIYGFSPTVQEVGIEDLSIEFPNQAYAGHLVERGYNAIYLDGVANSWIRNVTIVDADSGITTSSQTDAVSRFCTIDNVRLSNRWRASSGITGHHGIALEGPRDMLIKNFNVDKQFMHDLTVDMAASGNVFSSGRGLNMNFDHHRNAPNENLFTDIDVGAGDTLWIGSRNTDSGNADGGPPAAARNTVWNVRASNAQASLPNWPQLNVIGMLKYPTQKSGNLWVEQLDPAAISPSNLYVAQLAYRQSGEAGAPAPVLTSISVTPSTASVAASSSQQFAASSYDEAGNLMSPQPTLTWSVSGGGTINSSGLFSAGSASGGPYVVTASASGKSGTANVSVSAAASSGNVTLAPSADASVRDGSYAATNYGGSTALEAKNHDVSWSRNTYVKFDLANVAGSVSSAKLRLYGAISGTDPQLSVGVFSAGTSWTESGLTWNSQPSVGASALSTLTLSSTTARWNEWDVTSYVRSERSAGRNSIALLVKSTAYSPTVASFSSKEAGSNAPQLLLAVDGGSAPPPPPSNQAPTVATAAAANPGTVVGTSASLSALGADDGGEASLTYTWATTGTPPAAVAFSANATNAAKASTATFSKPGSYALRVTIADTQGSSVTSSVQVTVNATTTSVAVTPATATVAPNGTKQLSASALDQFGGAISPAPTFSWSASGGSISSSGLFTAGSSAGGPFSISASSGGKSGSASVTVSGDSSGSTTLAALADAYVRDGGYSSTNYGSEADLEVKTHLTDWSRSSFLKFDLSSVVSPITQVKLRLFGSVSADALSVQAFAVPSTSWSESTLTWSNQPTMSGSSLAQLLISGATAQWYEWDVTSYVQSEKSAGRSVVALGLKTSTYSASFAGFASKEAANAPQLLVLFGG